MSFLLRIKSGISLLIAVFILISVSFTINAKERSNTPGMDLECESAVLMEAHTGTVLYALNSDKALPPASVTKIMTLLLVMEAIENGSLRYTDTITTSAYAASMGGSQIFLKEGEQMSAEDMIKSVVISSANDAAVALAEHICGSEAAFVKRMNDRAEELGMKNTHFENTNGLDDTTSNHVTSAMDIALMSQELIKHKDILKYSSTWMDTIRNGSFGLTNTNRLVRFYPGATGLKTGSTDKAKFCISATAEREGMHLICVIMGAPSSSVRNSIATQLLNWGFSNYELYKSNPSISDAIKVTRGIDDRCHTICEAFYAVVPKGQAKRVETKITMPESIKAPVAQGDKIGKIEYFLNGENIGFSDVLSSNSIERIDFWTLLIRVFSNFLLK